MNKILKTPRLPIENKLIFISVLIGIGIITFLTFFYQAFSISLETERKNQTKNLSSSAMGVIYYFYHLTQTGELTESKAKQLAMDAIRSATYGQNGYFWINTGDGKMLMHPYKPETVDKTVLDMKDINGNFFFRDVISQAKKKSGWVTYNWSKPNSKEEYPKISYVNYFVPWDWVLGTGVYLDDMHKSIFKTIRKASGFMMVSFIFFVLSTILIFNHFVKKLGDLAIRDSLTDLYTKRLLYEIIPQILDKNNRQIEQVLAVVFFDIDFFKKVNDTYGHEWGDEVLKQISKILIQNTRPDDYCIRYGGEEFVLVGFYDNVASTLKAVERIREKVSSMVFRDKNFEFSITLSAGIAFHDEHKETFEDTLKRADNKLYESKKGGRNRVSK